MSVDTVHVVKGKLDSPKIVIQVQTPADRVEAVEGAVQTALDAISNAVIDQQALSFGENGEKPNGKVITATADGVVVTEGDKSEEPFNDAELLDQEPALEGAAVGD